MVGGLGRALHGTPCPVKKRKLDACDNLSDDMAPSLSNKQSVREIAASSSPPGSQDQLSPSLRHGSSQPSSQPSQLPLKNCQKCSPVNKTKKHKSQGSLPSLSQLKQLPSEETQSGSSPRKLRPVKTRPSAPRSWKSTSPPKASACRQSRPSPQSSRSLPSEDPEPTPRVPYASVALPDFPGLTRPSPHTSGMVSSVREQSQRITEDIKTIEEHCRYLYSEDPQSENKPVLPVRFAYLGDQASETSLIVAMIESILKKMRRVMRSVILLREHLVRSDVSGADMMDEVHTEYKKNARGMKMIQECVLGTRRSLDDFFDFYSNKDSKCT
ncbi:serine/arginine repetitive matrix protein 2-like isoform X2 [Patiria miniata]|uniref:Uncharacterized protein n=1 Tax=Patiria miniata TaxID=46514 RepID=A0A914ANA6_PATMI|nr:serine/arginine repetitive matrix protein 2-like isoform X2 [Patiria miniata]